MCCGLVAAGGSVAAATSVTASPRVPADSAVATSTAIDLSGTSVGYGLETMELVKVNVTSATSVDGFPLGTVILISGSNTVCTIGLEYGGGSCTVPATALPAGTDQLAAYYEGSAEFAASTSSPVTITVSQAATTTALSLSPLTVAYGNEQGERASVTVATGPLGLTPGGTVTVSSGTQTVCTITLASGSGSCAFPATGLPAGDSEVTASYGGDTDFRASTSAASPLTVTGAATTTSLALSASATPYGDEQAEQVLVTVSSPSGTPVGTVAVTAGATTVCTITLASGSGTCELPASALSAGLYQVTASYAGGGNFAASASGTSILSVSQVSSVTSLALSAASVPYEDEQAERLTVTVAPKYGGTPVGTVTVRSGTVTVCTITLESGGGTCTLAATRFAPGSTRLTAAYTGGADFAASASAAKTLTVAKAASKTALALSAARVIYGREQAERLTVTVTPQYGGTPVGTVTVRSGTVTVCTITLESGGGTCTLAATRFAPGSTRLTAAYTGGADFAASASGAKTLTVAKEASKTALALSAARVTYGREQAERLTVTVTPQFSGTPGGKVTIKTGATTVCTITLASGKGSCTLTATKLSVGTHTLFAAYLGSIDFVSSASAKKTLTVVK